ncbi:MAG: M13 family metallopeptidase [Flavobacteriales bacterium]|nr:M13 family metallopeptidase [Flavobacteriales bacterium]
MKYYILTLAVITLISCAQDNQNTEMTNTDTAVPGVVLEYMDTTIRPQDDFYRFVNGKWLETAEIPDDRTRWGSFDELRKMTDDDALAILKKASDSGDYAEGTDQWKAIQVFRSVLDSNSRNAAGVDPITPYLDKIDAVQSMEDLNALMAEMEPYGGIGFLGTYVYTDLKNSKMNTAYLGAGPLGLPEREYYVGDDEDSKEKREKYVKHVSRMLQFLGHSPEEADDRAARVLAFETRMAEPRLTKEDRRNPYNTYNPMAISQLEEIVPSVDWQMYLKTIGAGELDTIVVTQPEYFKALQAIFNEGEIEEWKNYMRWTMIDGTASFLTTDIERANWEFYSQELRGAKEQRPAEERALSTLNRTVGEALGKLYVDEKFPPEAKAKAEKMVSNVLEAYKVRIRNLDWMEPETQDKAIAKIDKLQIKIGYPDKWKDYSDLKIEAVDNGGTLFGNMLNVTKWNFDERMAKLGKEVDKTEWFMPPQTVNAYYNPTFNEIVFPAAILQPPFYNYQADMAVNYGGIGAVIGHEVSHGFDDQGAKFDADGNLTNWWTEDDETRFKELGKNLIAQYDSVEALPGINLNGEYTLGENIGDLGGVFSAYDGLQMHLAEEGDPGEIDGFTQEQRFFISWATIWRQLIREEALKNRIKTDPHSPGEYRGYMPIMNMKAFQEAFDIKEGDEMFLDDEQRVQIW